LDFLIGKTMVSVARATINGDDCIVFRADTGEAWSFFHQQDCCESVCIESIVGDLTDLVGSPILVAEEVTSWDVDLPAVYAVELALVRSSGNRCTYADGSETWTFYKFATLKGYVDIRWYGESNGYYSERVSVFPKDITEN